MRVRVCRLLQFAWHWPAGRFAFSGSGQGSGEPHSYPFHRVGRRSVSVSANPSGLPLPFRRIAPPSRRPAGLRPFRPSQAPLRVSVQPGPKAQSPEPTRWSRQRCRHRPHRRETRSEDLTSRQRRPSWDRRPDRFSRAERFQAETSNPPTLLPRRPSCFRQTMLHPERSRLPGFRLKARPTDRHPQPTRRSLRTPDFAGHVDTLLACKERFLQTRLANNKRMTF